MRIGNKHESMSDSDTETLWTSRKSWKKIEAFFKTLDSDVWSYGFSQGDFMVCCEETGGSEGFSTAMDLFRAINSGYFEN